MTEPIPRAPDLYELRDQDQLREIIERRLSTLELFVNNPLSTLNLSAISYDPVDPQNGRAVIWLSDGTATGGNGDVLIKVSAGGVTKTAYLFREITFAFTDEFSEEFA